MVVTFGEQGYWSNEEEDWTQDPDNAYWIKTGWQVRTYEGVVLIKSKDRAPCIDWLIINGFTVCPDGEHWQKEGGNNSEQVIQEFTPTGLQTYVARVELD